MPPRFPDLVPPPGWRGFSLPPQMRLVPPGQTLETARATIILSPIVPRVAAMPPPGELILQAVRFEEKHRLDVAERSEPKPAPSDTGLEGVYVEIRGRERGTTEDQRRLYAIYGDASFLYGINFMAFGAAWDEHVEAYWAAARSLRSFVGAIVERSPLISGE